MWTKMSSPPCEGRMNPWPWDLEKFLHTPLKTGPDLARTVLQRQIRGGGSIMFIFIFKPFNRLIACRNRNVLRWRRVYCREFPVVRNNVWIFNNSLGEYNTQKYKIEENRLRWVCTGAFGGQWAGQLSRLRRFPLSLPNPTALPQEGEGELQRCSGGSEWQRGVCCRWGGIRVWHLDWLQTGIVLILFCFLLLLLLFFRSPPVMHKEKRGKEGYTSCMAECVCGEEVCSERRCGPAVSCDFREGGKERWQSQLHCWQRRTDISLFL